MTVRLDEPFATLWRNRDAFTEVAQLSGEEFRRVKSRRTFRVEVAGHGFFVKHHHGVGWREIVKNLSQFKIPVLGARGEYLAPRRLESLGVATMSCAAFGERGRNPAAQESFLITRELFGMPSLEEFCAAWRTAPPPLSQRRDLARRLGEAVGKMHGGGVNHRDCYLCHFLRAPATGELYVIDLHRAQIRRRVPFRYAVKDVAGILFSAFDAGLSRRDLAGFWHAYVRFAGRPCRRFRAAVARAAFRLYVKEFHREPPAIQR